MKTEVPAFRRCCFCLPLRYGLLTWAYVKLVLLVSSAIFISMDLNRMISFYTKYKYPRDLHGVVVLSVMLATALTEICFTLSFIIGGHMKNVRLMRVFYIYNIVMWVIYFILMIVLLIVMVKDIQPGYKEVGYRSWRFLITIANFFLTMLIQIYYILLLRSEILKLEGKYGFSFVNNAAEGECAMREGPQTEREWKTIEGQEQNRTEPSAVE